MKLEFSDGTSRIEDRQFDPFFVGFNNNLILRESCYRCRYCGQERVADITIADYWGVGANTVPQDKMKLGVSLILANSEKGRNALSAIGDSFYYEEIDAGIAVAHNRALTEPNARPEGRSRFFTMMSKIGYNRSAKALLSKYYAVVYLRKLLIYIFGEKMFERIRRPMRREN